MDSPYAAELKVAIAAVQAASQLSTHVLAQAQQDGAQDGPSADDLGVVSKDDLSPVTLADFAIQALLTSTLHAAFPTDQFVGEETASALRRSPALQARVWAALQTVTDASGVTLPSSPEDMCALIDLCGTGHPGRGGRIWVFDPIDGTENFVQGLVYAVNAALLRDGEQVLSVVACPNMSAGVSYPASDAALDPAGEGFIALAVRGHGAHVRRLHGEDVEVTRLPRHAVGGGLRSVSARNSSGLGGVHAEVARRLGVEYPGSVLLPWVIRWVLLALGVGNSTWWVYKSRDRLAKIWDHAGAMLLFEEVGGRVSDVDGRPIDLTADRKMIANYGIVAAPEDLHGNLLATVQKVLAEERPDLVERPAA